MNGLRTTALCYTANYTVLRRFRRAPSGVSPNTAQSNLSATRRCAKPYADTYLGSVAAQTMQLSHPPRPHVHAFPFPPNPLPYQTRSPASEPISHPLPGPSLSLPTTIMYLVHPARDRCTRAFLRVARGHGSARASGVPEAPWIRFRAAKTGLARGVR